MYSVFVDESGTDSYDDPKQQVLCMTAVLIDDREITGLELAAEELLKGYGLPASTEIHCSPCIMREEDFAAFDKETAFKFLKDFLSTGLKYITAVHYMGMLKPWVKPWYRQKIAAQRLRPYSVQVVWTVVIIDRYFEHILDSYYSYFFDRTDQFRREIIKVIGKLHNDGNPRLRISRMKEPPLEVDSKASRVIQLADVAGYYLNRHRQIEIPNFRKSKEFRQELAKHENKILEAYQILHPKILDFINNELYMKLDPKAMENFCL